MREVDAFAYSITFDDPHTHCGGFVSVLKGKCGIDQVELEWNGLGLGKQM